MKIVQKCLKFCDQLELIKRYVNFANNEEVSQSFMQVNAFLTWSPRLNVITGSLKLEGKPWGHLVQSLSQIMLNTDPGFLGLCPPELWVISWKPPLFYSYTSISFCCVVQNCSITLSAKDLTGDNPVCWMCDSVAHS